ncbi:methylisocitrate lyase [Hyaloraphidium curvatum]|nr:methylisocitrate lyase [Hyaloraphidium curvatum]
MPPAAPSSASIASRRAAFRALHASGCFAIPNPWDGGSAVRLAKAGFKALASTSSGAAMALGRSDGEMSLEEVLDHLRLLVAATDLPVNADFEAGFADTPEGVAKNVALCVETGVAGLSIEDAANKKMLPLADAVARVRAAKEAIVASGHDVMLVGRCEAFLMNPLDMDEVIKRLKAYSEAGADVLYAPGLRKIEDVARVVRETDKPINALVNSVLSDPAISLSDYAAAGVRRVSVGGTLARLTYQAFDKIVEDFKADGRLP